MAWKLWYEDGATFDSGLGEPSASPAWGVVCVTQPDANSRDVLWNADFYLHRTDRDCWTAHDLPGLLDQLVHFAPVIDCVRQGRDMDSRGMKVIVTAATLEMRGR